MGELESALNRWQGAGLIAEDQAAAIRELELVRRASPDRSRPDAGGLSRGVEAIAYLGGALVLAGLVVAAAEFWPQLETWARVSLLAAGTVALHVTGWALHGHPTPALNRVTALMWALGTACLAAAVGVAVADVSELTAESVALISAIIALADACLLASLRPGVMQHAVVFVALLASVISALQHVERIRPEAVALCVWAVATVWILATWSELVEPRRTGYTIGAVTTLLAAATIGFGDWSGWGLALGVATSAGLLAASVPAGSLALLGVGTAGAFVFVTWTAGDRFAETIGVPLTLLVAGTTLVVVALGASRLRTHVTTEETA